jgi:hypothetical protein
MKKILKSSLINMIFCSLILGLFLAAAEVQIAGAETTFRQTGFGQWMAAHHRRNRKAKKRSVKKRVRKSFRRNNRR